VDPSVFTRLITENREEKGDFFGPPIKDDMLQCLAWVPKLVGGRAVEKCDLYLNKKVTFRLRRMGNFSEESIRWSGSYSDATKNVSNLYWFTVSVELTGIECPHGCHISLAAYGWINKK
jgi:hypothetical protein